MSLSKNRNIYISLNTYIYYMVSKNSKSLILTNKEIQVIDRKLKNMKLSQQDSNYLSKFIRPKLREINLIDAKYLLSKLEYNQKIPAIEKKIKAIILKEVKNISAIILYGSAIYTNYKDYEDIDVLVIVKKKSWKKLGEKYKIILRIKKLAKKKNLKLDIKIFSEKDMLESYSSSIALIYQLKDKKVIYGDLKFPKKITLNQLDLKMQLDYTYLILLDIEDYGLNEVEPKRIYSAIRNLWIINLILKKIVNNLDLINVMNYELGKNLISPMKNNSASNVQKKIATLYLKNLYDKTEKIIENIKEIKWEKEE